MSPVENSADFGSDAIGSFSFSNHEILGLHENADVQGHEASQLECVGGVAGNGLSGQNSTPPPSEPDSPGSTVPNHPEVLPNSGEVPNLGQAQCFDSAGIPIVCPPGFSSY